MQTRKGLKGKRIKKRHPQYGKLKTPKLIDPESGIEWVTEPAPKRAKRRFALLRKPGPAGITEQDTVR